METTKTFPEINGMNLRDVRAAIALAEINMNVIREDLRPALHAKLAALYERRRRLEATYARGAK